MPRWVRRTEEEVRDIVETLGYVYLNNYYGESKTHRRVIIQDKVGYKYDVDFSWLMKGSHPDFVSKANPFTLTHNIPLWIRKNEKEYNLLEDNSYEGSGEKLFFKCTVNSCLEIFEASWETIFAGHGCPYCCGQKAGKNNNLLSLRPNLAKEWDYEKNEKTPSDFTLGSEKRAFWVCSKCEYKWESIISSRVRGNGCPACYGRSVSEKKYAFFKIPRTRLRMASY